MELIAIAAKTNIQEGGQLEAERDGEHLKGATYLGSKQPWKETEQTSGVAEPHGPKGDGVSTHQMPLTCIN